jgi:nitrite reductase/ring-hydroxylating ferredoxin subunit
MAPRPVSPLPPFLGARVAGAGDLADGQTRAVKLNGRSFVILRVGETRLACENRCLHWGVRLSDGIQRGAVLECRWHHWRYDLHSGTVEADDSPFESFETFDVVVDGGDLLIEPAPRTELRRRSPCPTPIESP